MTAVWMRYVTCMGIMLLALGCGGDSGGGGGLSDLDETELVSALASGLPDYASRKAAEFNVHFVEGSAPDASTRRKYKDFVFSATDVSISGDSATMTIAPYFKGQQGADLTWTAVKQNGQWKLKDAPLP